MELKREDYWFLIERAFKEDLGQEGDLTSDAIFSEETASARIIAKQDGVLAGLPITEDVFHHCDSTLKLTLRRNDGDFFQNGDTILIIEGKVRSILKAERTALNFLGRLSGIATLTNQYVKAVSGTKCRILDTRKTTPGWRILEKYAVKMGGGVNHRIGLYDMVLIKDNHIAAAGGITSAVNRVREYMQKKARKVPIEVEVTDLDGLREALSLHVDRIMLDNMQPEIMSEAVRIASGKVPLEASGNVTLERVRQIAGTGVDFISVGALTHSAPNCDFSLLLGEW